MIAFEVNGKPAKVSGPESKRLLDVLREDLRLTGTKEGCGEGECGACSVILNGEAINSCLVPVCQVAGSLITTVEGLASDRGLDPVQQAFLECGGAQCGICTPGMLISARVLLDRNPSPSREEIREAIAGNLCRCTGYQKIIDAIEKAALIEGTQRSRRSQQKTRLSP
jgi:carbon-monoxide dehydrogenase small subunit